MMISLKRSRTRCAAFCLLMGWFPSLALGATAKPMDLMGVMGDSISHATFADSSVQAPRQAPRGWREEKRGVPFLGKIDNSDTLSWASGVRINSHYARLKKILAKEGASLAVLNVTVPGEVVSGMWEQASLLRRAMESGRYRALRYVTLMIGANDVCDNPMAPPSPTFTRDLANALRELAQIRQKEPIRVLVASMPAIPQLGRSEILRLRTAAGLTCARLRDGLLRYCRPLTMWNDTREYKNAMMAVEETNRLIEHVANEAQKSYSRLEVAYSDVFFRTKILAKWLAADCFHPNSVGHAEIAKKLWSDQPWFK